MSDWLPPGIGPLAAGVLVGLSVLCSALTASIGAGGGLLMLAAMAGLLPPLALIPVHGIVQLGSNGGRAWMSRRHVDWPLCGRLLGGAALGALLGSSVLVQLPAAWLQLAVAGFILWVAWAPLPRPTAGTGGGTFLFGALGGFLSLFVGATGPLVGAFVQRLSADRHGAIATMAACMVGLNIYKLLAFGYAGFAWQAWLGLCAIMVAGGLLGTRVGLGVLGRVPEARFRSVFRIVLSLLAAHAAWQGVRALLPPA
jgi:uncharacterized membrane protein YfcA